MGNRIKMMGICFGLLTVTLILMLITFRYLVNSYCSEKSQAETTKVEFQNQLDFLDRQLASPQDKFQLEAFQKYDQNHGSNLQAEFKNAYIVTSHDFAQQDAVLSLQALRNNKSLQVKNIQPDHFLFISLSGLY
jgi:hypothetical protein